MQSVDREVAMDDSDLLVVAGEKLRDGLIDSLAERAVEVLEGDDRHRRCHQSLEGSARYPPPRPGEPAEL